MVRQMKLSDRMDKFEAILTKHLEESGEIRSDLKWVKKGLWTMIGLGTTCGGVMLEELIRHAMAR